MRILYALNSAQHGGMEHHVLDLVEGMVQKGHEVYVWSPEGPLVERFINLGANHTQKAIKFECDLSYIFSLRKFLIANKIDVVHGHEVKAVMNALVAAYIAGVKVRIGHTHTPISEWTLQGIQNVKKYINILFYTVFINIFANYEIALTESRKKVKINEGIYKKKLVIIPNCVRVEQFNFSHEMRSKFRNELCEKYNIPTNAFIWGNVSRISSEKGHKILIDAFKKLLESDTEKENILLLAGGGPLESEICSYIKSLDLSKKIIVTGRFTDEDHKKFYATFDVFVHPTLAEGFGIVMIEAMASKLPIICSDLPVLKEVAADTVTYFEVNNSQDLYAKIQNFKPDDNKVSRAYNLVVQNYSFEQFINKYEALYKNTFMEVK